MTKTFPPRKFDMRSTLLEYAMRSDKRLIVVAALSYALFAVYLFVSLRYNVLVSDVQIYWNDSLKWQTPFSTWWVPGYPLLIAAVRGITFNLIGPIGIMLGISAIAYLTAVRAVYRLAIHNQFCRPCLLALTFALFPFVGLTYAVFPIADTTAIALLLLSVISYEKHQWNWFVVWAGASMIVQKVMWFFAPPLILVAFLKHRESRQLLPYAFVPLLLWMGTGAIYHQDILWFMRWSVDHLFVSSGSSPIFEGLTTPLLSQSPAKVLKGILVAVVMFLSMIFVHHGFRHSQWVGLCIALGLLVMVMFVNSYEIWVVVRYSRLLVIPLSFVGTQSEKRAQGISVTMIASFVFAVFIATNMAFGFYLTRFSEMKRVGRGAEVQTVLLEEMLNDRTTANHEQMTYRAEEIVPEQCTLSVLAWVKSSCTVVLFTYLVPPSRDIITKATHWEA
jgi:hypothetical protein